MHLTSNNLLNYHKPRKVPLGSSRGEDGDEAREGEDWARGRRMAVAGAETATLHVMPPVLYCTVPYCTILYSPLPPAPDRVLAVHLHVLPQAAQPQAFQAG